MSIKRILAEQGSGNTSLVRQTVSTNENYSMTAPYDDLIVVTEPVRIRLPDSPYPGQVVQIVTDSFRDGERLHIHGGDDNEFHLHIPGSSSVTLTFTPKGKQWVSSPVRGRRGPPGAAGAQGPAGPIGPSGAGNVVVTSVDYQATNADGTVDGNGTLTVTLPPNPAVGQKITIISDDPDSAVTVAGGMFPISTGDFLIPASEAQQIVFSASNEWIPLTDGPGGDAGSPVYLAQNVWYINALTGKDTNTGLTPAKALKTWNELNNNRWGKLNTLKPTGGVVDVFLLTDLPSTDPLSANVFVAGGIRVHGTPKVVGTGTVTGAVNLDTATNQAYQMTSPGLSPAANLRRTVEILTGAGAGSKANILKDLGGGQARMGVWWQDDGSGLAFSFPSSPPGVGDTFRTLDYSKATMGNFRVGWDPQNGFPFPFGPPGSFIVGGVEFFQIHFSQEQGGAPGFIPAATSFAENIADQQTLIAYQECMYDCQVDIPIYTYNAQFAGCSFGREFRVFGTCFEAAGCSHIPFADSSGNCVQLDQNSFYQADFIMCQGDSTGTVGAPQGNGLFSGGTAAVVGTFGTFEMRRPMFLFPNTNVNSEAGFYGDPTSQLFGTGNRLPVKLFANSTWTMFSGTTMASPVQNTGSPGILWESALFSAGSAVIQTSSAFDPATGLYTPNNRSNTKANLETSIGAGGFQFISSTDYVSLAQDVGVNTKVIFNGVGGP